jgi:putative oxidoreductase
MIRASAASRATVLIRVMVGAVFLSEGLQKFLYPAYVGAGRFERIGIPNPEVIAPLVGTVEIVCGTLVLLGLLTRWAVLPLLGIMAVAFLTTKLPVLAGQDLGPFRVRQLSYYGFWSFAHESRTDFSMVMGSLFLWWAGPGPWSLDARRTRTPVADTWSE